MTTPDSARAIRIDPDAEFQRLQLDSGSWIDVARGWLLGADELFEAMLAGVEWRPSRLFRYDHWVEERRLGAAWRPGTPLPHAALAEMHRAIQHRYHVRFTMFSMMQYRDGRDGQGFHRDTDMRWLEDTVIAIVSLGARRPWLLRPRSSKFDESPTKGATQDLAPGPGDLLVMGGRCQSDWEHSVAYRPRDNFGPRISIQWRHARRTGRPFMGSSYSAPLHFKR